MGDAVGAEGSSRFWYRDKARLAAAVREHGSVQAAAEALGVHRSTVAHWASRYKIRSGHPKTPGALEYREQIATTGHTYIVGAASTGLVKIGRTAGNPRARMATMQTGSPVRLYLLMTLPHPRWEDVLHNHYAGQREQGEWFQLSLADLHAVMAWAHRGEYGSWPSDRAAGSAGWDAPTAWLEAVFGS